MPPKKQTWKVVGVQPVEVDGKTHYPGDEFDATKGKVSFLIQVGAVEESKGKD